MDKVYAGARALALLVAIVAGIGVQVPQLATILLLLGGISAIGNKPEDNIRVYLVATVFTVASSNLAGFVAIGEQLRAIFGNIGGAATGAAAVGAVLAIVRMTLHAFGGMAAPAPAKAAA